MGRGVWQDVKGAGWGGGNREPWWSKRGWCWQSRWRPVTVLPVNHILAGDNLIGWSDCRACVCAAAAIREAEETNGKERGSTMNPCSLSPAHTQSSLFVFSKICSQSDHMTHFFNLCLCLNRMSPKPSHSFPVVSVS